jgi:hypothetical protein
MRQLAAIFWSLLPAEARVRHEAQGAPLAFGTGASAALQVALAGWMFVHFFAAYRARYMVNFLGGENAGSFVFGATLYVGFLFFSLPGFCSFYLFVEGMLRLAAAVVTHEPCGSLIVLLGFLLVRRAVGWQRVRALDPLVVDTVSHRAQGAVIETCRRRDWDELTTLELDGQHYRVAGYQERAQGPRRHVYMLLPAPPERVIRRLVRYTPDELLLPARRS